LKQKMVAGSYPNERVYSVTRYHPLLKGTAAEDTFSRKSSWLSKRRNVPRILQDDPTEEMKKIIKYYPKRISSLKQITLASCYYEFSDDTKALYCKIISKYKKDLFRYFCLNLEQEKMCPSSPLFLKSFRSVRDLSVHSEDSFIGKYKYFYQILKHNKLLSHLQINTKKSPSSQDDEDFLLTDLRYLPNLKSVQFSWIPIEDANDWRCSLSKVEELTIFDSLSEENAKYFVEGIKRISQLNSLKKLNCDFGISDEQILERIPFEDLTNRNIAFDFRVFGKRHIQNSKERMVNLKGLSQADFVGISCSGDWHSPSLANPFQLSSIELQKQSKNLFFFEKATQSALKSVFESCRNIITLDLLLSGFKDDRGYNFRRSLPNLNHLTSLRHLSLKIDYHNKGFENNWRTLTSFAQQHRSLTYLSLCIQSGYITKRNGQDIGLFFDALKDSLTTLLLSFGRTAIEEESSEVFSKSLCNLQKVKSLCLDMFDDDSWLIEPLKALISRGLNELKLTVNGSVTKEVLESIFKEAPKLTKILLEVDSLEKNLNFSKAFSNLTGLNDLELVASDMSKKNWNDLVRVLSKLKNLEILKVASWDNEFSLVDIDEGQIQQLIKDHSSLKLAAVGQLYEEKIQAIRITVQKNYLYNIDSFLFRFEEGLIDNADYKISYI